MTPVPKSRIFWSSSTWSKTSPTWNFTQNVITSPRQLAQLAGEQWHADPKDPPLTGSQVDGPRDAQPPPLGPARGELKSFCSHSCCSRTIGKLFILSRVHVLSCPGNEARRWTTPRKLASFRNSSRVSFSLRRWCNRLDVSQKTARLRALVSGRRIFCRDYRC